MLTRKDKKADMKKGNTEGGGGGGETDAYKKQSTGREQEGKDRKGVYPWTVTIEKK